MKSMEGETQERAPYRWNTEILVVLFKLLPVFLICLFFIWQRVTKANLERKIAYLKDKKEKLLRENDNLKIGIAKYTSAQRIESLYRKTYEYLPITVGDRMIHLVLPESKEENQIENSRDPK